MTTYQLTAAKPADVQVSSDGGTIYTSWDDGYIRAYSAATGALIQSWHVGMDLGAMDLSPNGAFIVVTEDQPLSGAMGSPWWNSNYVVGVYKLDLATGQVTTYSYAATSDEYTFVDVGVLSTGNVVLSQGIFPGWSGWATPKLLDLGTGSFTTASTSLMRGITIISASQDGTKMFFGETDTSDAPLDLYSSGTGQFVHHGNYQDGVSGYNSGVQAYSREAGLAAQVLGNHVNIYDDNLHLLRTVTPLPSTYQYEGAAFDATGAHLYLFDNTDHQIVDISTSSWAVVRTIAVPASWTPPSSLTSTFGDLLTVDPAGRYFGVITSQGLQLVSDPAAPAITGTEGADTLSGTILDDTINGLGGNDIISGGRGADTINGGDGDDILNADAFGDPYAGASANYSFPDRGSEIDTLNGGAGNDTISAGYGDNVDGGPGFDTLMLTLAGASAGVSIDFTGFAGGGNLTIGGGTISGVELISSVTGSAYADTLDAHAATSGFYSISGGGGDDLIRAGAATTNVSGGDGNDIIDASAVTSAFLATFSGDAGNDLLIGGHSLESLKGGTGDDVYRVYDSRVSVSENPGEGIDEVQTTLAAYTLPANVEKLTGLSTAGQALTGNALDNLIKGSDGADTLDGGAGADTMAGGAGDDVYYVDNVGDVVVENPGEGYDEIRTTLASYTLAANVEKLTGLGSGQTLTGNDLDNVITGSGSVTLDGAGGNDTLSVVNPASAHVWGGTGTDTLIADLSGGTGAVTTASGQNEPPAGNPDGYHLVYSGGGVSVDANGIENFRITTGTGDDYIVTGDGDDQVSLGGGNDFLRAGKGSIVADGGSGIDGISVDFSTSTSSIYVNLQTGTLTGVPGSSITGFEYFGSFGPYRGLATGSGDDIVITANVAQPNSIDTGAGNDTITLYNGSAAISGGAGYDTLILDWSGSTTSVTTSSSGVDQAGGYDISLADQGGRSVFAIMVEKLVITTGSGNDNFTTTDGDDVISAGAGADQIHAGAGNDVIDGGAGADTMYGGTGNDVYYVDDPNDVIIENPGEGYDEVRTTVANYALPANVEKLTYVGTGNFNFTGSGGNDDVGGAGGNDFFDLSQGGADKASGGGGNDAFYFGAAWGTGDSVDGGAGADTVGFKGDYTGGHSALIASGTMLGVETLTLMSNNGAGGIGYDVTLADGNLAAGQQLTVYAGALTAGENVTFDGSAETHGYLVYYGGLGTDNVKGGALSDGFYFGPGKFTADDHVDGGGGSQNQLGLDGSYDFEAGSALGTLGGNFAHIQSIVLYRGNPADPSAPYPNTYHIEVNDAAVAAGAQLTIYGIPVISSLYFDGSGETDGSFRILSGTGDDVLKGSHGDDVLFGNMGADLMAGNGGNDTFLYTDVLQSFGAGTDHIFDFSIGDRIDLSAIDADITQAGDQAFTWIGSAAFSNHAGELHVELDGNQWLIAADIDGDGRADMTILLNTTDNHTLTASDFVL